MQALLENISTFFDSNIGWMDELIGTIVSQPVLLIPCVCMPVIGFSVGLLSRLIRVN